MPVPVCVQSPEALALLDSARVTAGQAVAAASRAPARLPASFPADAAALVVSVESERAVVHAGVSTRVLVVAVLLLRTLPCVP